VDLDVFLKIDNKDKFLLNSLLIATLLFYDKRTIMISAFAIVEYMQIGLILTREVTKSNKRLLKDFFN